MPEGKVSRFVYRFYIGRVQRRKMGGIKMLDLEYNCTISRVLPFSGNVVYYVRGGFPD